MSYPNYELMAYEAEYVNRIVKRAKRELPDLDPFRLMMSLALCHSNGCPLCFDYLHDLGPLEFARDVEGIYNGVDRQTGETSYQPQSTVEKVGRETVPDYDDSLSGV